MRKLLLIVATGLGVVECAPVRAVGLRDNVASSAACEVALSYLASNPKLGSQSESLSAVAPRLSLGTTSVERIAEGWAGNTPSRDLLKRFLASHDQSALSCKDIRSTISARGGGIVETPSERFGSDGRYKGTGVLLSLSLPVLAHDGGSALVLSSYVGPGLRSGETLIAMTRVNGAWSVTGRKLISIS